MLSRGNTLITGGTVNHLMLINVKARGLTGSKGVTTSPVLLKYAHLGYPFAWATRRPQDMHWT